MASYRLPGTVVPSHYDLVLEPDLDGGRFTGSCVTTLDVREPTDTVTCNADELEIAEAWLQQRGATERRAASVELEQETERVHFRVPVTLDPGQWELHTRFEGELNSKLVGFYRSRFTADGTDHTIAVTQFEATHARKAFPCWDEPERKAVYEATLVVADGLTVLSNAAEIDSTRLPDGRRRVRFAPTMPMSTYLVAFVVGPLELTGERNAGGVPLRVAYPPGNGHLTDFALDSAAFALSWFADYYGLPYPGDKCDLVAVPDFAFGAMENLGCITFREVLLLVDPDRATQPELMNVADVIHHELAHMWFGDLVTMKWWNGIWLNEAFATFMEMKCTEALRPDWERWVAFGLSRTAAFEVDALRSTRPIEFEVVSPSDAEAMFDVLTYEKGAAVLRMIEQYLGEDRFREGIRRYLAEHAYGNTETTDLWDAIEEASEQPVRRMADTWIFQGGHPRVDVRAEGARLHLRQAPFLLDDGSGDSIEPTRWVVPVLVRYGRGDATADARALLDSEQGTIDLAFEPDWFLLNAGGSGFYRTRYEPQDLAVLGARLDQLSSVERYGLLDDTFAGLLAGTTSSAEVCEFLRHFSDDDDLAVWQRVAGVLGTLDRLPDASARDRFQALVRTLAGPALRRAGWAPGAGETDRQRQRRATLFELAGTIGADPEALDRARATDRAHHQDPSSVDAPLAAAAVAVVAEAGGPAEFDDLLTRYREASNPQEGIRFLYALARFPHRPSFERVLELSLTEVRTQNAPFLLRLALSNREHGALAWEFVKAHWDEIIEKFPASTIVRMAEGVRWLARPDLARDVEAFFGEHPVPQGGRTLAQHLERMRVNVALAGRERERFTAWLM